MKKEEFDSKLSSMLDKIGSEPSNLILDDVAYLLNDNEKMNKELEDKEKMIADLKTRNERLQQVNGNLLQQISVADDKPKNEPEKKVDNGRPYFDMRDCFDKNGNFVR